ncbi:hypothetical protein [Thiomicrorhabdus sp.]|uniref:hypothetical protein n=1 Tax=Thiomicrorhabdus sp. TaxID=2039724 RepID=UPI0029C6A217|nr:hypothetical protein [Thiomicrorhabdus sp.]
MKALFTKTLMLFFTSLLLTACGGGSGDSINTKETLQDINYSLNYLPTEDQNFAVKGNGSDTLNIHFPKYAVDVTKDNLEGIPLNVTLDYEDNRLKGISFDKDLEFNQPVAITFNVTSLADDSRFLVYLGDTDSYPIPFVKNGSEYTYTFNHFSDYEFQSPGSSSDQINEIESILTELEGYADKSEGVGPHTAEFGNLLALIAMLEIQNNELSETYLQRTHAVMEDFAKAYINFVQDPAVYLNGYCMDASLEDKFRELIKNWAVLEEVGSDAPERTQAESKITEWTTNLVNAYVAVSPSNACDDLGSYLTCGLNIAAIAEEFGSVNQSETVTNKMQSELSAMIDDITSQQVNADLGNCDEILNCLNIGLQYANFLGMTSEVSQLENRISEVEETCHRSNCPFAWDATATIDAHYDNSTYVFSHQARFTDMLFITNEEEYDAADLNNDCASLTTVRVDGSASFYDGSSTLSYSGTFDDYTWTGTILPTVHFEDEESMAEFADFTSDLVPYIRNGQAFTITVSHETSGGSGTLQSSITFTPHVPH